MWHVYVCWLLVARAALACMQQGCLGWVLVCGCPEPCFLCVLLQER